MLALTLLLLSCAPKHQLIAQSKFPKPFKVEKIDSANGKKDELFVKANEWVAKTFNSAKDVIQMHDKDAGEIIVKAIVSVNEHFGIRRGNYIIKYTFSIYIKDDKYKLVFSDFVLNECSTINGSVSFNTYLENLKSPSPLDISTKTWNRIKESCLGKTNDLKNDFALAMKTKSNNW